MSSALERTLRISSLVCSVLAIAILIPATVESFNVASYCCFYIHGDSFLVFGFIPLFFTIITSAFYLALQRRRKDGEVASSHPLLWITTDFMIFGGYMVALVFEWVDGPGRLHAAPNIAFLEAYATVPLMVNMLIHMTAFFINAKTAFRALVAKTWTKTSECPHCHHRIDTRTVEVAQKRSGEGYSLLRGEDYDDDAGRASEDRAAIDTVGEV